MEITKFQPKPISSESIPSTLDKDYAKASKLLQKVQDIIELDGDEFTDGECIDMLYNLKIDEFLKDGNT